MSTWTATLETLLRERGAALFGYAYVLTGDRHAADDLVQDALVRTFQHGRGTYALDQAHTYVKRAMLSAFIDGRRRAATRPARSSLAADKATPDATNAIASSITVHQALLTLPPRERACMVLRYLDDLPVAGVARELDLATGTVKRYLSDAAARLRRTHPELADLDAALDGGTHEVQIIVKETRA